MKKKDKSNNFGFSDECWEIVQNYLQEFDTPEKRTQDILRRIDFRGCSYCGTKEVRMNSDGRSAYCSKCRANSQITAGTFFHGMSRLDVLHPQIYFLEAGVKFSAHQIRTLFECAYGTAWGANKKIKKVIMDAMNGALDEIHSCFFESLYVKRSIETPARHHPRAEQRLVEDLQGNHSEQKNGNDTQSTWETADSTNHQTNSESSIIEPDHPLLSVFDDQPISLERIISKVQKPFSEVCMELLYLELDNLVEKLPGNKYVRKATAKGNGLFISSIQLFEQNDHKPQDGINKIVDFIKEVFHGVSRKYLQFFLAIFWHHHDKTRWRRGQLIEACLNHDHVSINEIKKFNTSLKVQCFSAQSAGPNALTYPEASI